MLRAMWMASSSMADADDRILLMMRDGTGYCTVLVNVKAQHSTVVCVVEC
jgi:hypothetical protein